MAGAVADICGDGEERTVREGSARTDVTREWAWACEDVCLCLNARGDASCEKMIIGWWTVYRFIQLFETMQVVWNAKFNNKFTGQTPPPLQLQRIRSQYWRVPQQPTAQNTIKAHGIIVQIRTWLKRCHCITYKQTILKHLNELVHDCLHAEKCTQPAEAHLQFFCATDFHTSSLQCQMYLVTYVCACASQCIGIQRVDRVDRIAPSTDQKYADNPTWREFVYVTERRNQMFQGGNTSASSSSDKRVQRTPTTSVASTGCKRKREPSSANEASDAQRVRVVVAN